MKPLCCSTRRTRSGIVLLKYLSTWEKILPFGHSHFHGKVKFGLIKGTNDFGYNCYTQNTKHTQVVENLSFLILSDKQSFKQIDKAQILLQFRKSPNSFGNGVLDMREVTCCFHECEIFQNLLQLGKWMYSEPRGVFYTLMYFVCYVQSIFS